MSVSVEPPPNVLEGEMGGGGWGGVGERRWVRVGGEAPNTARVSREEEGTQERYDPLQTCYRLGMTHIQSTVDNTRCFISAAQRSGSGTNERVGESERKKEKERKN